MSGSLALLFIALRSFQTCHEKSYLILRDFLRIHDVTYLTVAQYHYLVAYLHENIEVLTDKQYRDSLFLLLVA
jgi:hypothetical protein